MTRPSYFLFLFPSSAPRGAEADRRARRTPRLAQILGAEDLAFAILYRFEQPHHIVGQRNCTALTALCLLVLKPNHGRVQVHLAPLDCQGFAQAAPRPVQEGAAAGDDAISLGLAARAGLSPITRRRG
jgi:hypothetical protein